jgi:hypothetical protein
MSLARLLCAAKPNEGLAAGFFLREAGADAGVSVERDVGIEFGREVGVCALSGEEAAETKDEGAKLTHRNSSGLFGRGEEAGEDGGGLLPLGGGFLQLAVAGAGELIKFGAAIVF